MEVWPEYIAAQAVLIHECSDALMTPYTLFCNETIEQQLQPRGLTNHTGG